MRSTMKQPHINAMFEDLSLDLHNVELPRYIAVEGCIGVGKTTLARNIANLFNYDMLLEQPEENPFLTRFYQDPKSTALPTQLFFLFHFRYFGNLVHLPILKYLQLVLLNCEKQYN